MSRSAVHAASVQCLFSNSSSGNLTTVSVNLPDDNINGIGVMIAFLLGAYLPWVVAAAFYVTGLIPPRYVNNYDTLFLKIKPRPSSDLVQSLRKGFFSFSIQQLVLSISLLSAAFAKIAEMIQFDFHTVIYMAWMTFTAHLATLFLLQDYFISSPVYRAVELFSMLVLMILLCVALYPTTNWSWSTSVLTQALCPDPAHCSALINKVPLFLQRARESNGSGGLSPQGVLSYFVIIASYIWQATSLLNSEGHVLKKVMRKPIFWVERAISHIASNEANGKRATFTKFRRSTLVGLYCFLLALLDLLGSFAFHLFIVFVAQGWGLIQLLIPRFHVLPACIREALSQWDFGQIFPMIILLTPLYGVVENISKSSFGGAREDTTDISPVEGESQDTVDQIGITRGSRTILALFEDLPEHGSASRQIIHEILYTTLLFRIILGLLSFTAIGSAVGYCAESIVGYTGPSRPLTWITTCWHLFPDIIFTVTVLAIIFMLSVFGPFFCQKTFA